MTHLRILSLNVVEQINLWRTHLMENYQFGIDKNKNAYHLPYLYDDKNYIFKMNHDLGFLEKTILNRYFYFLNKADPFLMSLTLSQGDDDGRVVQYISKSMLKRLKTCEQMIQEEYLANQAQFLNSGKPLRRKISQQSKESLSQ